jgi:hypothetical protein
MRTPPEDAVAKLVIPAVAAPVLALLALTDGEALATILAITCAFVDLGIWLVRRPA